MPISSSGFDLWEVFRLLRGIGRVVAALRRAPDTDATAGSGPARPPPDGAVAATAAATDGSGHRARDAD